MTLTLSDGAKDKISMAPRELRALLNASTSVICSYTRLQCCGAWCQLAETVHIIKPFLLSDVKLCAHCGNQAACRAVRTCGVFAGRVSASDSVSEHVQVCTWVHVRMLIPTLAFTCTRASVYVARVHVVASARAGDLFEGRC